MKSKVSMKYFDPRETPSSEYRKSSAARLYPFSAAKVDTPPKSPTTENFAEHEAQYATSKSYREWVMKKAAENRLYDDQVREQELIKKLFDRYVQETQALSQSGTSVRRQYYNIENGINSMKT